MALRIPVAVSAVLLALSAQVSQAQAPAFSGDARRGQALTYTCNGCHAISNYKNVYPTYSVPKLHNQRPEYLVAALKAYKSGERSHGTMHAQASSMSEQDMADIAAYLWSVVAAEDSVRFENLDPVYHHVFSVSPALRFELLSHVTAAA